MICIYCGERPADTVDHMPPRMAFENKQRPDVLVFPACGVCNSATKDNDAIVSWFSRLHYGPGFSSITPDFKKLSRGMYRYPDLTKEFRFREQLRYVRNSRGVIVPSDLVTVDVGPITRAALEQFALKFTIAMHWHHSGEIVPADAPIWIMGTTNYHMMTNPHIQRLLSSFKKLELMRQGAMTSAHQFAYQSEYVDKTGESVHYGVFRASFAVCGQVRPALQNSLPADSIRRRRDLLRPYPYIDISRLQDT